MKNAIYIFIILLLLNSCYSRYQSNFYSNDSDSTKFSIVKDSLIDFHFYIHGFEWRSSYSKVEYEINKRNSSLDFYFNINEQPAILINNFEMSIVGVYNNDTLDFNNGEIYIDLSGNSVPGDSLRNQKLIFHSNNYDLKDTIPLISGLDNYFFPKDRCSYCYYLFIVKIQNPLTSDCNEYYLSLKIDFKANEKNYKVIKKYRIYRKIEKRSEIGIH